MTHLPLFSMLIFASPDVDGAVRNTGIAGMIIRIFVNAQGHTTPDPAAVTIPTDSHNDVPRARVTTTTYGYNAASEGRTTGQS